MKKDSKKNKVVKTTIHGGDKENIKRLKKEITSEKDEYERGQLECELWEAQCEYYGDFDGNDRQSEKDLLLNKLILEKDQRLFNLEGKFEAAYLEIKYLNLEEEIDDKIKSRNKGDAVAYKEVVKKRLQEISDEMDYLEKWIEIARREIKLGKYQNAPEDIINSIHMDGEGLSFWEEDD